jgi:hypothetical protein
MKRTFVFFLDMFMLLHCLMESSCFLTCNLLLQHRVVLNFGVKPLYYIKTAKAGLFKASLKLNYTKQGKHNRGKPKTETLVHHQLTKLVLQKIA